MTELNPRQQMQALAFGVSLLVIALRERTTTLAKPETVKPQVLQEAGALCDAFMQLVPKVPT